MNTSEAEKKKLPEWNIFDRLAELEDITLELIDKTKVVEPKLKDTSTLARDAVILATQSLLFSYASATSSRGNPRLGKDLLIKILKKSGLSKTRLKKVEASLNMVCDAFEHVERETQL